MLKLAVSAAKEAGRYAADHIDKVKKIEHKGGYNNIVTDIDKKCEEIIIGKITEIFPLHSILAEETGEHRVDSRAAVKWVVDPIDGTTNYAHGFPIFCTSIGVLLNDESLIGVVYDASRDELFTAERGCGAFLNGKKITVSSVALLRDSLVATGFAYDAEGKAANLDYFKAALSKVQAVRRAGSAALDLCYVASGRFDGFWEMELSPWDTAAAHLIVQEAGGTVSTFARGAFNIFKKEIAASNGKIHNEMLELFEGSGSLPTPHTEAQRAEGSL